ncbi:MAG: DsbA family oxidoreductase [Gammaproteobacteria bacterium]|jgi:predicted DsbA family dithiol-disulfide isomerase
MSANPTSVTLDIVSDIICPWCYIGKRRLQRALELLDPAIELNVRWQPYELNPAMPPGGLECGAYYTAKFGSEAGAANLIENVTANAHNDGLEMDYARIARVPNTIPAHRAIAYAAQTHCQDAVVDGLFRAYFVDGRNIEDNDVLADIAVAAGIDSTAVAALLASDEGFDSVRGAAKQARRSGIQGVPAFVFNGRFLFSGAQSPETISLSIERAVAKSL